MSRKSHNEINDTDFVLKLKIEKKMRSFILGLPLRLLIFKQTTGRIKKKFNNGNLRGNYIAVHCKVRR